MVALANMILGLTAGVGCKGNYKIRPYGSEASLPHGGHYLDVSVTDIELLVVGSTARAVAAAIIIAVALAVAVPVPVAALVFAMVLVVAASAGAAAVQEAAVTIW